MKHNIFTVFDQKAKAHLPPFFLPEIGMAERTFADCCNDKEHQFGKHPEDYTLMRIGTFDDQTAYIKILEVPEVLGTGVKYVQSSSRANGAEVEDIVHLEDVASG